MCATCRFLIADLGILRYPQYVVRRTRAVWPDRRSLLAYEAALRHAELLDTALEVLFAAVSEAADHHYLAHEDETYPDRPRPDCSGYVTTVFLLRLTDMHLAHM